MTTLETILVALLILSWMSNFFMCKRIKSLEENLFWWRREAYDLQMKEGGYK